MSARIVILLVMLIHLVYSVFLQILADRQRKKPLPQVVADFYDEERYRTYLSYVADSKKISLVEKAVDLAVSVILVLSPVYKGLETLCGANPYGTSVLTLLLFTAVSEVISIPFEWIETFRIREKYKLNKKDKKEFCKDILLDLFGSLLMEGALLVFFVFVGTHMYGWTRGFSLTWWQTGLIVLALLLAAGIVMTVMQFFSLFILRKQYRFHDMEEGELLSRIRGLMTGCKKKVRRIRVYDESRKSNGKNAFLLKIWWYREFGIADNVMEENAQDELLAVLSHEIGHLKHKKNIFNYLTWAAGIGAAAVFYLLVLNPAPVLAVSAWVRDSFSLSSTNYYLLAMTAGELFTPLMFLGGIFNNWRSRREEYEADSEAVKNGYGEALIGTFRQMSSDELVNINPHPVNEFLLYDHPGMVNRITALRKGIREKEGKEHAGDLDQKR